MRRCMTIRSASSGGSGLKCRSRRWASYDKSSLTKDALLKKVEAGLGGDGDGTKLKIDVDAKMIATAAGDLPISPLFDPAWISARRQAKKDEPGPASGRFRRKLANNPYARALATPIRTCLNTEIYLPRYFLQDFELVRHPETGEGWWAPGPLSFEFLQPTKRPDTADESSETLTQEDGSVTAAEATSTSLSSSARDDDSEPDKPRPRRGPVTGYVLSRKAIVDMMGGPNRKYVSLLSAVRSGMAMTPETRNSVWRPDMGDVLLRMMRQQAVGALITRANKEYEPKDRFVLACADWDAVNVARLRGCVLWLPEKRDAVGQYATHDVEGAKYGAKMAVHNLWWLLGEEEVRRLREVAPLFREHEIFVLRQWPSISLMRLHMLLWRLQGYLAEVGSSKVDDKKGARRGGEKGDQSPSSKPNME